MKPTKPRCAERGTQVVELALVLPLLLFMAFLVSEGAGVIRAHQMLNNAAREGAHLSAMPENKCNGATNCLNALKTAVVNYASVNGLTITNANVTIDQGKLITFPGGTSGTGSQVTVTYSYPLIYLPALPFFKIPKSVALQNAVEFRNFY